MNKSQIKSSTFYQTVSDLTFNLKLFVLTTQSLKFLIHIDIHIDCVCSVKCVESLYKYMGHQETPDKKYHIFVGSC